MKTTRCPTKASIKTIQKCFESNEKPSVRPFDYSFVYSCHGISINSRRWGTCATNYCGYFLLRSCGLIPLELFLNATNLESLNYLGICESRAISEGKRLLHELDIFCNWLLELQQLRAQRWSFLWQCCVSLSWFCSAELYVEIFICSIYLFVEHKFCKT